MKFYPAFLDLRGRPCLVIGGGAVAERKILSLVGAGASVTVVSPVLTARLQEMAASGAIAHLPKKFDEQDLADSFLVVAATDSADVNRHAAQACRSRQVLVNVAVPPGESTFIVPSVVEREDLLIAVSTGGASPALAKRIRRELEVRYGPEYGLFLDKLSDVRRRVLGAVPEEEKRRAIFQAIVDSEVIDLLRQGRLQEADARMNELSGPGR